VKARFAILLIALAAAVSLITTGQAMAAEYVGYSAGSDVWCRDGAFGASPELWIKARVSRSPYLSSQWVGYTHYIQNIDTGAKTYLQSSADGSAWATFKDTHVINSGWPYVETGEVVNDFTRIGEAVPHGRYRIYTAYSWWQGSYWRTSDYKPASVYSNYGIGTGFQNSCSL
jgi:hypothetical protein